MGHVQLEEGQLVIFCGWKMVVFLSCIQITFICSGFFPSCFSIHFPLLLQQIPAAPVSLRQQKLLYCYLGARNLNKLFSKFTSRCVSVGILQKIETEERKIRKIIYFTNVKDSQTKHKLQMITNIQEHLREDRAGQEILFCVPMVLTLVENVVVKTMCYLYKRKYTYFLLKRKELYTTFVRVLHCNTECVCWEVLL